MSKWKSLPENPEIPTRLDRKEGGIGTHGRCTNLRTNYFEVTFSNPKITLHHYDVKIDEGLKDYADSRDKKAAAFLPVGMSLPSTPAGGAEDGGRGGKGKRRKKGRAKAPKDGAADSGGAKAPDGAADSGGAKALKAGAADSGGAKAPKDGAADSGGAKAPKDGAADSGRAKANKDGAADSGGAKAPDGAADSGGAKALKAGAADSGGTKAPKDGAADSGGAKAPKDGAADSGGAKAPKDGAADSGGAKANKDGAADSGGAKAPKGGAADSGGAKANKGGAADSGRAKAPKDGAADSGGAQAVASTSGAVVPLGSGDPPGSPPDQRARGERWIPKAKRRRIFAAFMEEQQREKRVFAKHWMAYDGEANAYSASNPPQLKMNDPVSYEFNFNDPVEQRTSKYVLTFKLTATAKLQDLLSSLPRGKELPVGHQKIFQMLEIMFNYERSIKFSTVGRNQFYSQSDQLFGANYDIGGGKQGVIGFYCSLRARCGGDSGALMLNLDVSHTAFYKVQPLMEFLESLNILSRGSRCRLDERTIQGIEKEVVKKDIRIVATHTGNYKRRYKVTGVSHHNSNTHTFPVQVVGGTRTMSVAEYFLHRYNHRIQYPEMNCIMVGSKGSLLPIEVCEIAPDQRVEGKLADDETGYFIRKTAVEPGVRFENIQNILRLNDFSTDSVLQSLNVSINPKPVEVIGRVLDPPIVELLNSEPRVDKGKWREDRDNFKNPAQLECWAVISFSPHAKASVSPHAKARSVEPFMDALMTAARTRGMNPIPPVYCGDARPDDAVTELTEIKRKFPKIQLILCVVDKSGDIYKSIKETGDRVIHVITQCVLSRNVTGISAATVSNILLKINAKLGGTNHQSTYREPEFSNLFGPAENVLVMGADVNHPAAHDSSTPSHVAVVGSLDRYGCRYAVEVRHQSHRKEMITDMKEITVNLFKQYFKATRRKPTRIIMYRDGVSETQFTQVLAYELKAMREACGQLQPDYDPPMTFICVQKRHHTRLHADTRDGDRDGNVLAGTVVDHTITSLAHRDFFLCSHSAIQGTSKPSHYTVLWDDCDMSMNELQLLTYSLCHNYARCFRSVSIPAPVYNAHLAAARAKVHLEGALCNKSEDFRWSAVQSSTGTYLEEDIASATRVELNAPLADEMFFN